MATNMQKVVVGGLAGGVVIFILDFLSNEVVMGDQMKAAMDALNPNLTANMESTGTLVGFCIIDLVFGLLLAWLYAAVRPNYGPGPRTATRVGIYFWLVTGLVWASLVLMGLFSWGMYVWGAILWLITSVAGANVAGWLYKEPATT